MVYSQFPVRRDESVRMILRDEEQPQELDAETFKQKTGVSLVSSLVFPSEAVCFCVRSQCPWLLKHTPIGRECRELGKFYANELSQRKKTDAYIAWAGEMRGYGLFAGNELQAGAWIGLYAGLVRKLSRIHPDHNPYCAQYPTQLGSFHYYIVDARKYGNETRYINHSSQANTDVKCVLFDSIVYFVFVLNRDICKGEEISCDYGSDYWQTRTPF